MINDALCTSVMKPLISWYVRSKIFRIILNVRVLENLNLQLG